MDRVWLKIHYSFIKALFGKFLKIVLSIFVSPGVLFLKLLNVFSTS